MTESVSDAAKDLRSDESQAAVAQKLALGKELFLHAWQPNDNLAGGDGLGPVFNGHSCAECHSEGGLGGAGTNEHSVHAYEILPSKAGENVRAGVIHLFATRPSDQEDLAALDRHFRPGKVAAGEGPPGSRQLANIRDIDATRLVWVNSPALWGAGRIDRLSAEELRRSVKWPQGKGAFGRIEGRFRRHADGRIGKFGWKGQFASLRDFVLEACANELGLSTEHSPQYVPREFRRDQQARQDLDSNQVDALVEFVAHLPEPRQVMPADPAERARAEKGGQLMASLGCIDCHTRDVGNVQNVYGDYRLHRVEDTLSTSNEYYHRDLELVIQPPKDYPRLDEWRTPALWGVADTAPYWHDGSAKTLEDAILRHASEAARVTLAYRRLTREDQESVLAFLNTLRAPAATKTPETKVALSSAK